MSNKNVGTQHTDPFDWVMSFAFETIATTFVLPLIFVMLVASQVIGYVFKSIMRAFSSKAADLNKISTQPEARITERILPIEKGQQPVSSSSGIEAYPGWCFVVIVMIFGMFSFFFFETTTKRTSLPSSSQNKKISSGYILNNMQTIREASEQGQAEAQIYLGKINQDGNGIWQSNAEKAELKSFTLAAVEPLNQATTKQFSKFDYQIVQDNLKASGLYLGPINGVWGKSSQNALTDLKRLMMSHGNECGLDDISLIATIIKTSEETLSKSEAVKAEDVKNANAIFATEHDKNMFWANTKLNNEECALTWADDKCVAKKLFDAYWENHKTTATSIDLKSCDTQSAPVYNNRIEMVRGYYRANGTYVEPYYRTIANGSVADNWSTKGNLNPFTGKRGSKNW